MKPHDRALFDAIFSDALVIDVDLSREDGEIALLVVADHVLEAQDRLQAYLVRFQRVRVFSLTRGNPARGGMFSIANFRIHEASAPPGVGGGDELSIELVDGYAASNDRPSDVCLEIRCQGVAFDPVHSQLLEMVAPGWGKPGNNALIRPGVLAMAAAVRTGTGARKGW